MHEIFCPSTLPASSTCALKVFWVACEFYKFSISRCIFLHDLQSCWLVQFLAPLKYCGKDFHSLTTLHEKWSCICFESSWCWFDQRPRFCIKRDHEKSVSVPFLCLSCFYKSLSSLLLLIFFSSLKNPGMQFIPNFQLAETWDGVFMVLLNQDLVPAYHLNLHFETPLKPFPILPLWNKQHSLILRAAKFSIQRDVIILSRNGSNLK